MSMLHVYVCLHASYCKINQHILKRLNIYSREELLLELAMQTWEICI